MRTVIKQRWDGDERDSASTAVIETIAKKEGCDPLDLPETLYDVIEPDALDRLALFDGTTVGFAFNGFDVRVRGADDITVSRRAPPEA